MPSPINERALRRKCGRASLPLPSCSNYSSGHVRSCFVLSRRVPGFGGCRHHRRCGAGRSSTPFRDQPARSGQAMVERRADRSVSDPAESRQRRRIGRRRRASGARPSVGLRHFVERRQRGAIFIELTFLKVEITEDLERISSSSLSEPGLIRWISTKSKGWHVQCRVLSLPANSLWRLRRNEKATCYFDNHCSTFVWHDRLQDFDAIDCASQAGSYRQPAFDSYVSR